MDVLGGGGEGLGGEVLTLDGRYCGGRLESLDDSGGSRADWDRQCTSTIAQLKEYFVESLMLFVCSCLKANFFIER